MTLRIAPTPLLLLCGATNLSACDPAIGTEEWQTSLKTEAAVSSPPRMPVKNVRPLVQQTADDVDSSDAFFTSASFHFDLSDDQITGDVRYEERSEAGGEVCRIDTALLGSSDADLDAEVGSEALGGEAVWTYRFEATEADASACRVPQKGMGFLRAEEGTHGIVRFGEHMSVGLKEYDQVVLLGTKVGESLVTKVVVNVEDSGAGEQPPGFHVSDHALDFVVSDKHHVSSLYDADCPDVRSERDYSAVQVAEPFAGTLACSEDGMQADVWSVQLEAGQQLRAAVMPVEDGGGFRFVLLSPEGCRQVLGRGTDNCPDGKVCGTVKQTAQVSGEYTLIVEGGVRCSQNQGSYELHVEVW